MAYRPDFPRAEAHVWDARMSVLPCEALISWGRTPSFGTPQANNVMQALFRLLTERRTLRRSHRPRNGLRGVGRGGRRGLRQRDSNEKRIRRGGRTGLDIRASPYELGSQQPQDAREARTAVSQV